MCQNRAGGEDKFSIVSAVQALSKYKILVPFGIFFLSLVLRLLCFFQLSDSPAVSMHRWEESDMSFFDVWAQDITRGNIFSDGSLHPYHHWHEEVAKAALALYAEPKSQGFDESQSTKEYQAHLREMWLKWYGGTRFHQEPLYAYTVALVKVLFGNDVRWIFAAQAAFGLIAILLIYHLCLRFLGHLAAVFSGLLAALSGPTLFYEFVLLRASMISYIGITLVFVVVLAEHRRSPRWWLLVGVACGLSILLKKIFLLFAVGLLLVHIYRCRHEPYLSLERLSALAVGLLLPLSPVMARNLSVGAPLFSLSSVDTVTFITSNHALYQPQLRGFSFNPQETARILTTSQGHFLPAVKETLATHPNVTSYLGQLAQKVAVTYHWYEAPQNINFYYFRMHSSVLQYLPTGFWMVGPLAVVGVVLSYKKWSFLWPLVLLLATHVAAIMISYSIARFRAPLNVALIPFASLTLVRLIERGRARQYRILGGSIILLILLYVIVLRPLPDQISTTVRPADYTVAYFYHYNPIVKTAVDANDWVQVTRLFKEIVATEPNYLYDLGRQKNRLSTEDSELARFFSEVRYSYAVALAEAGKKTEATRQFNKASRLKAASSFQNSQ